MAVLELLTFSSLYPNPEAPRHGIFVRERLRHLLASGQVTAYILAPVPWFPFRFRIFGRYAKMARVPRTETQEGLTVEHPRYLSLPKIGMSLAPFLMAVSLLPHVRRIRARTGPGLVIDAHFLYPDGVAAALIGRWLGLPVILTARGQDVTQLTRFRIPRRLILWSVAQAAKVITVSEALRRDLIALGADPDQVVTLRNGVDLQRFRPLDRSECRRRAGFTGTTLLSIGNLVEVKDHELLIRALAFLPDVRLHVIGEGRLDNYLQRLISKLGLQERVWISGHVPHGDLVALYNAADALVLTSRREGLPNVMLESLACGTRVVATAVGGVPEILNSPEAGALVHDRDPAAVARAITTLLTQPVERSRTRARAEQLGWPETIAGLLAVLQQSVRRTDDSPQASRTLRVRPPRH
jgi:glycosyltransferase involved in cell wall biosynthesis